VVPARLWREMDPSTKASLVLGKYHTRLFTPHFSRP